MCENEIFKTLKYEDYTGCETHLLYHTTQKYELCIKTVSESFVFTVG